MSITKKQKRRETARTGHIKPTSQQTKGELTEQQKVEVAAIAELERLGGVTFREEDIIFKGKQLVLPDGMDIEGGIAFLEMKLEEESVNTDFNRTFKYRPWDVAFCTWNALRRTFGSVGHNSSTVQTFFGPKKMPPQLIDIPISATEAISVPWGNFTIPYLPGVEFELGGTNSRADGLVGYINAHGPKKWRHAIHGVFELVERELAERSLYRGKQFDGQDYPNFLDLSKHQPHKMVYSAETMQQLQASLWGSITYREQLAYQGIPFKRAVLLEGVFGTGKSMAINHTGRVCQDEGITFILVRPGRDDLRAALMTARIYQPAVVAFEDVDTVASADEDAKHISEILDVFDGIEAKNTDIMLVLTTNHVGKLHRGMLRPGRLDAIINIGPPDAGAIRKLLEVNVPNLAHQIDWDAVAGSMEGYTPAFVVEAGQRAVRYIVASGGDRRTPVGTEQLVGAGKGLRPQYELMQDARDTDERPRLDTSLVEVIRPMVEKVFDDFSDKIDWAGRPFDTRADN